MSEYTPGRFVMATTDAAGARDTIALTSQVKYMRDGLERALGRRPALILVVVDEPQLDAAAALMKAALDPPEPEVTA